MDGSVLWRAALLQALTLVVVALLLGAFLDKEFFRSWGWLAGPGRLGRVRAVHRRRAAAAAAGGARRGPRWPGCPAS